HPRAVEPGHQYRRGAAAGAAAAQVTRDVLVARVDRARSVVHRVIAGPGQRRHVIQREPDRSSVGPPVALAEFAATVIAPAPGAPRRVHGQGAVVGHDVGGYRRDLHAWREAHEDGLANLTAMGAGPDRPATRRRAAEQPCAAGGVCRRSRRTYPRRSGWSSCSYTWSGT